MKIQNMENTYFQAFSTIRNKKHSNHNYMQRWQMKIYVLFNLTVLAEVSESA